MKLSKRSIKNRIVISLCIIFVLYLSFSSICSFAEAINYKKLKVFTEVLSIIRAEYVDEVSYEDMIYGAVKGMLQTLDAHSSFMTPDMYKEMQVETKGEFGGLGIEITMRNGVLTVVSPIEDTPAYKAGIQSGDKILKVDDELTKGMSMVEAVHKMRGKRGTKVTITILRDSFTEPKDFTIVRDVIKIKSVTYEMLEEKIGYVKLKAFQENSSKNLKKALTKLRTDGMQSLVLDLRNNPGGLLDEAVNLLICSHSKFTQVAGSLIQVQPGEQELLIFLRRGFNNPAFFKMELNPLNLPPGKDCRVSEPDPTLSRIFHRAGKDFPAGHILFPIRVNKMPTHD